MSQDAGRFFDAPGPDLLPLYEAKLIHQFDHRWASYVEGRASGSMDTRDLADGDKANPRRSVQPRYWVRESDVEERLGDRWNRQWLLGWRDITNVTNERSVICAIIPRVAVGNKVPLIFPGIDDPTLTACLASNLNSFVLDYAARQKIGGTTLNFYLLKQFPVLAPDAYDAVARAWIADRVLELTYTAWDLQLFAQDLGYKGPPFRWNPERRFEIRCELDAAYFHLYEIGRDDVDYIMSTFPIVERKDIAAHGTYRTRDRILELYDAMASGEWTTDLDPAPADPRAAHDA